MALFENTLPLTNRQPIKFKCSSCGACCKNVRDSIVLEPLDAFRIVREYIKNGFAGTGDEVLDQIADLKELSRGFDVFVLKTVNDSGVCGMLKDNRCTVYTARPRTCRLYPFTVDPSADGSMKWFLCTEQSHHFGKGSVTAREWQRRNLSGEDEEYLREECRVLPVLGRLMRNISDADLHEAEKQTLLFRYLAYDYTQPFLPQYKDNMLFLKAQLSRLQQEQQNEGEI